MHFRKTSEEEPSVGITPLIDIVFLLLIFFMVTSHFHVATGVPIDLPKVTQKTYESESAKITLSIDKKGLMYLKGDRIDFKELMPTLKRLVDEEGLVHLLLEADRDTKHGTIVRVMDLAKRAGVRSIIISARWDPNMEL